MTDILAEAIRAGCDTRFNDIGKCVYPNCMTPRLPCPIAVMETAALKSAYPRDPSAETLRCIKFALRHGADQRLMTILDQEADDIARAIYYALPVVRALYATSPSDPT